MSLFNILFGSNGESAIKRAISIAHAREGEQIQTKVPWKDADTFVKQRGKTVNILDDGRISAHIPMSINYENISVTFMKNRLDGYMMVEAISEKRRKQIHAEKMQSLMINI